MAVSLPVIARRIDKRLKVRRTERMVRRLESWRGLMKGIDASALQDTNFYYDLRYCLSEAAIKNIINAAPENTAESLLAEDLVKLEEKWETKELERKTLRECSSATRRRRSPGVKRIALALWDWWTSV